MAPAKLTEAEKETIFRLYRETDETTSTLSRQYGVSVSTISRLLKSKLPLEEYEDLVRLKRSGLNRNIDESELDESGLDESGLDESGLDESGLDESGLDESGFDGSFDGSLDGSEDEDEDDESWTAAPDLDAESKPTDLLEQPRSTTSDPLGGDRRRRRRSSASQTEGEVEQYPQVIAEQTVPEQIVPDKPIAGQGSPVNQPQLFQSEFQGQIQGDQASTARQLDLDLLSSSLSSSLSSERRETESSTSFDRPILRKSSESEPSASDPDPTEEQSLEDEEEDYVYSFGDEEFGDDDEDDFDDEEAEDEALDLAPMLGQEIEIIPLSEAHFPRVCYLVVDRTAELVTCRLQDFRELGQIPESEAQHRTLPLFDNHRVARRFSRRNQRVIKLPDGRMLHKTARSLEAKGITRLLLDGKVYDLQEGAT